MAHETGDQPATIWEVIAPQLPQKEETSLRFVSRALGLKLSEVEALLKLPPLTALPLPLLGSIFHHSKHLEYDTQECIEISKNRGG